MAIRFYLAQPIRTLFLIFFIACFGNNTLYAQTGDLKGFVIDNSNGDPIAFATLSIKSLDLVSGTDQDGYYSFMKVPVGTYKVEITSIGFDTLTTTITIVADKSLKKNFALSPKVYTIRRITVSDNRKKKENDPDISKTTITPRQLTRIPTVGGAPDLVQYLQVLPGVVFSGDQGGQLYIRGGSPVMNKVLLDGMTLYNPFHSIGLFSVFDADLIKSADVYSAGFGVEFGGRISAIVDIKTKDGNRTRTSGSASISPFTAKINLEGPLKKYKKNEGYSSYILSVKNSYLEQTSKIFYNYADPARLPYNFNDIYGKITFNAPSGSYFKMFGFNFTDRVNFPNTTNYRWTSSGMGGKFLMVPEESKTKIDGILAYSNYFIEQVEKDAKPRESGISGFNLGLNFEYGINKDILKYGLEVNGFRTEFTLFNSNNRKIEQFENTTEIAGYVLYRFLRKRFVLETGIRSQFYASLGNSSFEPRITGKYNLLPNFRAKAAVGLYSQNLLSAFSDRDVVNLFYGFLSGPDNLPREFNGKPVVHRLQKARHAVLGVEWEPSKKVEVNLEGFIKDFPQISNINRDKLFDDTPEYADQPDVLKKDYIIESGLAYGGDVSFRYSDKKYYVWLVYSLTYVNRFDGTNTYNPHWDRRHNINFLASTYLDKKKTWEANARWNLGSGFPFTQTQGFYEKNDFQQGIGTDYTQANGMLGIHYATVNGGRLPYYHRLDISVRKDFVDKTKLKIWAVFSLTNVYNRDNIFYFDRVSYKRVNQLPILPALSYNMAF